MERQCDYEVEGQLVSLREDKEATGVFITKQDGTMRFVSYSLARKVVEFEKGDLDGQ